MKPENECDIFNQMVADEIYQIYQCEILRLLKADRENGLVEIRATMMPGADIEIVKEEILECERALAEGRLREPPEPKIFNDFNIKSIMNNSKIADE